MNIKFIALCGALLVFVSSGMATTVNVSLEPVGKPVIVGEQFTLDLWFRSTSPTVFDNICLYLNFDHTKLQLLGTSSPAHLGYVFRTIPVYSWSSATAVTSDYELPGLVFKALAPTNDAVIQMAGQGTDQYGNSTLAVRLGCTDLTGTLNSGHVQIITSPPDNPPVPEPLTVVAVLAGLFAVGLYMRKRTALPVPTKS